MLLLGAMMNNINSSHFPYLLNELADISLWIVDVYGMISSLFTSVVSVRFWCEGRWLYLLLYRIL